MSGTVQGNREMGFYEWALTTNKPMENENGEMTFGSVASGLATKTFAVVTSPAALFLGIQGCNSNDKQPVADVKVESVEIKYIEDEEFKALLKDIVLNSNPGLPLMAVNGKIKEFYGFLSENHKKVISHFAESYAELVKSDPDTAKELIVEISSLAEVSNSQTTIRTIEEKLGLVEQAKAQVQSSSASSVTLANSSMELLAADIKNSLSVPTTSAVLKPRVELVTGSLGKVNMRAVIEQHLHMIPTAEAETASKTVTMVGNIAASDIAYTVMLQSLGRMIDTKLSSVKTPIMPPNVAALESPVVDGVQWMALIQTETDYATPMFASGAAYFKTMEDIYSMFAGPDKVAGGNDGLLKTKVNRTGDEVKILDETGADVTDQVVKAAEAAFVNANGMEQMSVHRARMQGRSFATLFSSFDKEQFLKMLLREFAPEQVVAAPRPPRPRRSGGSRPRPTVDPTPPAEGKCCKNSLDTNTIIGCGVSGRNVSKEKYKGCPGLRKQVMNSL